MSVAQLLKTVSSRELVEWVAYDELEPFGFQIENWWVAAQMSVLANINRDKKHKPTEFKVEDFLFKPQLRDLEGKEEPSVMGKLFR